MTRSRRGSLDSEPTWRNDARREHQPVVTRALPSCVCVCVYSTYIRICGGSFFISRALDLAREDALMRA